jgi:PAS domain S-box-containing protein
VLCIQLNREKFYKPWVPAMHFPSKFNWVVRQKWYWLYFVLAAFDLLTISFSLYLNHGLMAIYTESVRVNQEWASQLNRYSELAQLAGAVNAPGNDVFDSQDVDRESARLKTALAAFNQAFVETGDELAPLDPGESAPLLGDLAQVRRAMDEMVGEAEGLLDYFRNQQRDQAGERMASMDRKYADLSGAFARLNRNVREIQKAHFTAQETAALSQRRYETLIAGCIAIMVLGVTFYGNKMAAAMVASTKERERVLAELQESEERFRQLAENIDEVFWMTPPDKNKILYVSPAYERIWGRSCAELYNFPSTWLDAIHPEDQSRVSAALAKQAQGDYDEEYRITRSDGAERWIRDRAFPIRDPHGLIYRIAGLAEDITEHKHYERELKSFNETLEQRVAQRTAEAKRLVTKLRALTAELLLTEERERRQLAADLHDDLGQSLALVKIKLANLGPSMDDSVSSSRGETLRAVRARVGPSWVVCEASKNCEESLREVRELIDQANERVRSLTFDLRPPMLDQLGLVPALQWLAEHMKQHYHLEVGVEGEEDPVKLDEHIRYALFRAVRELLINVARHAQTDQARVSFTWLPERVRVEVEDRGKGFDASVFTTDPEAAGFGLFSTRERMDNLGGSFDIHSAPGEGTRVTLEVPLFVALPQKEAL